MYHQNNKMFYPITIIFSMLSKLRHKVSYLILYHHPNYGDYLYPNENLHLLKNRTYLLHHNPLLIVFRLIFIHLPCPKSTILHKNNLNM